MALAPFVFQSILDKMIPTDEAAPLPGRKFVDWEIRYTLHCEHGLVAISRPGLADADACLPDRLSDNHKTGYAKWYTYPITAANLKSIIDEAYVADASKIENSREKKSRNSSC